MKRIFATMKPLGFFGLLQALCFATFAQTGSTDKNRIITQGFRQATTTPSGGITSIQYLDGLGRPTQGVIKQGSPNSKDLVTGTVSYDEFGRPKKTILPVEVTTTDATFQANLESTATTFYNDNSPFATVEEYEKSPFSRVKKQVGPGAAWNGTAKKGNQAFYETNIDPIRRWVPSATGIDGTGSFAAQTLMKMRSKDENENEVIEYSDKDGRIIRKDVQDNSGWITTCYAYDDFGRLAYIIPPRLNESGTTSFTFESAKGFVFAYKYDKRGRVTQKWVPGAGWTYFVYNKLNQVMMSQNARQAAEKKWSFAKYDALGRIITTGVVTYTGTPPGRTDLQTPFDSQTSDFYEVRTNGTFSNQSFPASIRNSGTWENLILNYYDDYTWSPAQGTGTGWTYNATGKLTGQKVKELGSTNVYRESDYYFDDRDRILKAFYQNTFSDYNEATYTYEGLTGDVKIETIKYKNGSTITTVVTTYEYDALGRVTRVKHKIDAETERILAEYKYDQIGRLIQKRIQPGDYRLISEVQETFTRSTAISTVVVDSARVQINLAINAFKVLPGGDYTAKVSNGDDYTNSDALQTIDYTYHIRGGLRCVNCDNTGAPKLNVGQNDLFALKLDYEDNINQIAYYNGNIRQQTWVSYNNPEHPRIYNYLYDKADRLTGANYSGNKLAGENYSVSGIGYDKNSNISGITRQGMTNTTTKAFGSIDQLSYTYKPGSNLLQNVVDGITGNEDVGDFRDQSNTYDYDYAPDSSLQADRNKGITSIVYNDLGLPSIVSFTGNKTISYVYDGSGNKLGKTITTSTQTNAINYDGAVTYINGQIAYIQHSEGRAINPTLTGESGGFTYEYHYRDHLGNLRVAFRQQTPGGGGGVSATMEPAQAVQEETNFRHVSDTRTGGIAHTGNFSAELKGETGPSKTMRVVAGERITASVFGYLPEPEKEKKKALVPIPILGPERIQTEFGNNKHFVLRGGMAVPFTYRKKQNNEETKPNAYLQVVLLDTANKPVFTERKYLDSIAIGGWKELKIIHTPTQNGTLQVTLVNENARTAAYFDDLTISDEPPLIVQENHYDPWGLNLVGIEVTGTPEDFYQFNGGSEKSYSLHDKSYLYETDFRFYDPQSGRFWGIDALAGEFGSVSPMQFGYNNPVGFNDPTGLFGSGPGPYFFGQLGNMHKNVFNLSGLLSTMANVGSTFWRGMSNEVYRTRLETFVNQNKIPSNQIFYFDKVKGSGYGGSAIVLQEIDGHFYKHTFRSSQNGIYNLFSPQNDSRYEKWDLDFDLYGIPIPNEGDLADGVIDVSISLAGSTLKTLNGIDVFLKGAAKTKSIYPILRGPLHHIFTNKNKINGNQWTLKFEPLFKKAGYTLDDAVNKVYVPGHKGPHPASYHNYVYQKLLNATQGLHGKKYKSTFDKVLLDIATDAQTTGSYVNKLLTK